MNFVIYGAGYNCNVFFDYYLRNKEVFANDSIIAIVDNDPPKWGMKKHGITIVPPEVINYEKVDCAVITPNDNVGIYKDYEIKYPEIKLYSIKEFTQYKNINYQYKKNLNKNSGKTGDFHKFSNDSLVIYTAITKGYDNLKSPQYIIPNAKYICFTDDETIKSDVWEIRGVDGGVSDRMLKILPHRFLNEYETSIWVDANIQIIGDLSEYATKYQRNANVLFFPHGIRKCIYEEIAACIYLNKADKLELINQAMRYKMEGYPFDNNLLCGGCIVRNHNMTKIQNVMELWWKEYLQGAKRDQIGLPYVFWKENTEYDLSNENIYNNKWFRVDKHR